MKEALRILHIVRQFHPAVGGLEAYVKAMAEHQRRLGHECSVLTLNRIFHGKSGPLRSREVIDGIPVHRVPFIGTRRMFIPLLSPSFFKEYDVIHVHNTDFFFDYISFLIGRSGKPAFATTHGGFFHTKDFLPVKKVWFSLITRNSGKRYRALFATSQNDYNTFQGANDNLTLKPNAIAPPGDFLTKGKDFIYLGRLAKHKGMEELIRTFAAMKANHNIPGRLHIVGPEWDVKKEDLAALATDLGVESDVTLHGFLDPIEMEAVFKASGFFLSASTFEGFGMSMLEAMAVGLIPFVQPNESFSELVSAGSVGACVDFTKPEKAAAQIAEGVCGVSAKNREKAREFALGFSWERLAKETITAYKEYGG